MITSAKNKKKRLKKLWEGQAAEDAIDRGGVFAQHQYYIKRHYRRSFITPLQVYKAGLRIASRTFGYRGRYARVWAELFIQGYEGMNDAIREHLVDHPDIRG